MVCSYVLDSVEKILTMITREEAVSCVQYIYDFCLFRVNCAEYIGKLVISIICMWVEQFWSALIWINLLETWILNFQCILGYIEKGKQLFWLIAKFYCVFPQPQMKYPGFVMLSREGVSSSPDKIKDVRDYPTPRNVKDIHAFLGLTLFYRRLV